MSSFEKNLSEGNVAKQLILFSLPFLASNYYTVFIQCGRYADCWALQRHNQYVRR